MYNNRRSSSGGFPRRNNNRFGGGRRYSNQSKGSTLNPMMFVNRASGVEEAPYVSVNNFSDFPFAAMIHKNIQSRGYDKPTAIQDQAMTPILNGRDLVGIANTGTGKTAAFLLPLLTKVAQDRTQKVLIVTPTRELAAQIQDEFRLFSQGMGIYSTLVIGGSSINVQAKQLYRRPQFVIGTPGRLKDLIGRGELNLMLFQNVVLDEVDRMVDIGFINDIKYLISLLPKIRQSLFFSATVDGKTQDILRSFVINPVTVSVKQQATAET